MFLVVSSVCTTETLVRACTEIGKFVQTFSQRERSYPDIKIVFLFSIDLQFIPSIVTADVSFNKINKIFERT